MEHELRTGTGVVRVRLERDADGYVATIGDRRLAVRVARNDAGDKTFLIDGRVHRAHVARTKDRVEVHASGNRYVFGLPAVDADTWGAEEAAAGDGRITTPMPGKIVAINVSPGESVASGQPLLVLESMKMQNDVVSNVAGAVTRIHHAVGDNVEFGDLLVEIDPAEDA